MNKLVIKAIGLVALLLLFTGHALAACNFNNEIETGVISPAFPGTLGPVTGLKQLGSPVEVQAAGYECRLFNSQATLTLSEWPAGGGTNGGLDKNRSKGPHQIDPSGRQLYEVGIPGIYVSFSVESKEGGSVSLKATPTSSSHYAFNDDSGVMNLMLYMWEDTNYNPAGGDLSAVGLTGSVYLDFDNQGNHEQVNFTINFGAPTPECDASASIESASGSGGLIPLGTFTAPAVNNGETTQTPFTLHLTGCFSVNKIGLKLTGTSATNDKTLLGQTTPGAAGAATGVGVKISTANGNYNVNAGTQIKANDAGVVDFSADPNQPFDGQRDIKLNAQLVRDGTSAASGGTVSAVGTFTFNAD